MALPLQVQAEYSVSAQHSMPTLDYGNACAYLGEPYINNCGYDPMVKVFHRTMAG